MNKIVPFKKDIIFDNNISEVTSISLEHTLKRDDNLVSGTFTISGEYKTSDTSINTEKFSHDLPFTINIEPKYNLENAKIDINDFYYEVISNNVMRVNIEVIIDEIEEQRCIDNSDESIKDSEAVKETKKSEEYQSYTVYIVREGDTIETILENYSLTKDDLLNYNDISEIKVGDKIIIPC